MRASSGAAEVSLREKGRSPRWLSSTPLSRATLSHRQHFFDSRDLGRVQVVQPRECQGTAIAIHLITSTLTTPCLRWAAKQPVRLEDWVVGGKSGRPQRPTAVQLLLSILLLTGFLSACHLGPSEPAPGAAPDVDATVTAAVQAALADHDAALPTPKPRATSDIETTPSAPVSTVLDGVATATVSVTTTPTTTVLVAPSMETEQLPINADAGTTLPSGSIPMIPHPAP